ncbi:hypothetical protein [Neobacillus sp. D3-1R]|uniref:hypothetical protein n=1 Tax=Neobacillus sp. D3-1R TaxID=3445778 RepID=UPI003FA16916
MTDRYENEVFGFGIATNNTANGATKLSEDRYEIYVNEDFVGYKSLHNVSDQISDVDDFIKSQGIVEFKGQLEGDHYYINGENPERLKDILSIYCRNR